MLRSPTFAEAARFWLKLGLISFGGPAGQIAIMHTELVERRRWVEEDRFLHALNFCMLLPGPEAQQLAIYNGWLLHGARGGLVAGTLFVLPAAILLWALSWLYAAHGALPALAAVFDGLKPAVIALVFAAGWRIAVKTLRTPALAGIALAALFAIGWLKLPFPLVVLSAGALGWFFLPKTATPVNLPSAPIPPTNPPRAAWTRAARLLGVGLLLWLAPTFLAGLCLGWNSVLFKQGVFFSKAALVTFGGAYAVLPYVAQQAVEHYAWLQPHQMIDGLALAETTPGPLIIVLEFVGFLGAWRSSGNLSPLLAGTLGAALTVWTTFTPCFIFVFLGAPYGERLRANRRLAGALSAVTAAVVGVIFNLALWFAARALFPAGPRLDLIALTTTAAALYALAARKWNVLAVIAICGALGYLRWLAR